MNRLIIIGASGHGRVVADIAVLNGYKDVVFIDENSELKNCAGFPVVGSENVISELEGELFVAIGNNTTRKRIMERHAARSFPTLIHPNAVIANGTVIGDGTVIMAGVVVNPNVRIGRGCIVNTSSSIDHDCIVGDYVHIAVGARLCGTAKVGELTWVGAGATVSNNVSICGGCMVGAGAVAIRDIDCPGTYIGVPAHKKPEDRAWAK